MDHKCYHFTPLKKKQKTNKKKLKKSKKKKKQYCANSENTNVVGRQQMGQIHGV